MQIVKENQGLFVRVVREITHHADGQSIESFREYRPWVIVVFGAVMVGFCVWVWTVASVGAIGLLK